MGANRMTGTSWHIETLKKKVDDDRRHKSRCVRYYDGKCYLTFIKCTGSAHCSKYSENPNQMPEAITEMKMKSNKNPDYKKAKVSIREQSNKLKVNHKVVLYDLKERQNITVRLVKGSPDISKENVYDITIDSVLGSKIVDCKVRDIIRVNEFEYRVVSIIK